MAKAIWKLLMLNQIEKSSQNLEENYKEIKIVRGDDMEYNTILKLHVWNRIPGEEEKRKIIIKTEENLSETE